MISNIFLSAGSLSQARLHSPLKCQCPPLLLYRSQICSALHFAIIEYVCRARISVLSRLFFPELSVVFPPVYTPSLFLSYIEHRILPLINSQSCLKMSEPIYHIGEPGQPYRFMCGLRNINIRMSHFCLEKSVHTLAEVSRFYCILKPLTSV